MSLQYKYVIDPLYTTILRARQDLHLFAPVCFTSLVRRVHGYLIGSPAGA